MQALRQRQEDPLNLGSLPMVAPAKDGWPAIESELLKSGKRRSLARYAGAALAMAASLTLAIGLLLEPAGPPTHGQQGPAPVDISPSARSTPARQAGTGDSRAALISLSQQLEQGLRRYRAQMGDMPSAALVYQVELEDLVAQVDEQLSMNPDSLGLWSQRVQLMTDLTRLYENSLRREYDQIASL